MFGRINPESLSEPILQLLLSGSVEMEQAACTATYTIKSVTLLNAEGTGR